MRSQAHLSFLAPGAQFKLLVRVHRQKLDQEQPPQGFLGQRPSQAHAGVRADGMERKGFGRSVVVQEMPHEPLARAPDGGVRLTCATDRVGQGEFEQIAYRNADAAHAVALDLEPTGIRAMGAAFPFVGVEVPIEDFAGIWRHEIRGKVHPTVFPGIVAISGQVVLNVPHQTLGGIPGGGAPREVLEVIGLLHSSRQVNLFARTVHHRQQFVLGAGRRIADPKRQRSGRFASLPNLQNAADPRQVVAIVSSIVFHSDAG